MNFNYLTIEESNDLSLAKQIETISLRHIETLENDLKEFNFIIDFLKQYENKKIDKRKVEKLNELLDRPYHNTQYGRILDSKGYFIRESGNMINLTRLDYSNSKRKYGLTILIGYDKNKIINISGKTSLRESLSIISNALFVVGGDTGMIHAAEAFNKHVVAIFGPTNI